jgi:NAD(P)-dependent dehydrogenase (short-subunit alcohol dehydrogenase family)
MRLQDKVCIVTGAGRNLGQQYAVRLGQEGAKLVVCDVLDCAETAELVQATGAEVLALQVDVTSEEQTKELARRTMDEYGRIDCLLNNAGLMRNLGANSLIELDLDTWDRVFAVNVKGSLLCIRAVFPYMKEQGSGKIINVSSGTWLHTSRTANSSNSHYVASKAAVMALTRSVARELGQFNIKVNTLAPGATEVGLGEDEDPSSDPERALGRRGRAEDLTGAVVFLFSEDSDFVTGQMLLVNGGMEVY